MRLSLAVSCLTLAVLQPRGLVFALRSSATLKAHSAMVESGSGSTGGATVSAAGRICSMSQAKESPSAEPLNWCTEYKENSCCSVAEDEKLMQEFDTFWRSAAGACPGCLTNVKAFQCAYTCSPSQADFVTVKRDAKGEKVESATIRMCSQFCSSYHSSCGNITIAEMEGGNANAFCQGFVSFATYKFGESFCKVGWCVRESGPGVGSSPGWKPCLPPHLLSPPLPPAHCHFNICILAAYTFFYFFHTHAHTNT